jgi:RNA polymerase sigma factor (sigma-70 family)
MPPPAVATAAGPPVTEIHPAADAATLARSYGRQVFQAAFRVLGDEAAAEDVQQDVFLRLLEGGSAADVDSWPAWLCAAATRLAIDRLRRQHRWWRLLPGWKAAQPESMPSAEDEAAAHERTVRMRTALARLKPREAECFVLRHVQGLDIGAIAAATQMSPNHVSVTLHRATRSLAARLAEPAITGQGATS